MHKEKRQPPHSLLKSSLAAVLGMTLILSGCSSSSVELEAQALSGTEQLSGESVLSLPGTSLWLATSEKKGLLLMDEQGNISSRLDGAMEQLDIRHQVLLENKLRSLAVTVDSESNRPLLVQVDTDRAELKRVAVLPKPTFDIAGLCLYRDEQKNVYMFLMDGIGKGEQWLILDGVSEKISSRLVRDISLPPNSEHCSVDDTTDRLYVSEEGMGVWAYSAHPEAEPGRSIVKLVQPWGAEGDHSENVAGVAALPGGVMTIDPDTATLSVYKVAADSTSELSYTTIVEGMSEPESVSVAQIEGGVSIGLFDDALDQYFTAGLEWSPEKVVKETIPEVMPVAQTRAMDRFGDIADDPAIWINPDNAAQSLVLGTNKKSGLHVYDLQGRERQSFRTGRLNNVDIRYGLKLKGDTVEEMIDVAVATNRSDNSLALFRIDRKTGRVSEAGSIATDLSAVYGTCMYQPNPGEMHVFVNDKNGTYQQFRLQTEAGRITGDRVRTFKVESQPEGCVASDSTGQLFVGEENAGLWVIGADADAGTKLTSLAKIGDALHDDVEGMGIYETTEESFLVVSSQGNNSYAIFETLEPYRYRGSFRIGMNAQGGIDGASETDGLEVTSVNLGGAFSEGMLVVQDGHNVMPSMPQNFKYVPWSSIRLALNLD